MGLPFLFCPNGGKKVEIYIQCIGKLLRFVSNLWRLTNNY